MGAVPRPLFFLFLFFLVSSALVFAPAAAQVTYQGCKTLSIINQYRLYYAIEEDTFHGQLVAPKLTRSEPMWLAFGLSSTTTTVDAMIGGGACSDIMMAAAGAITCPDVTPAEDNCLDGLCNSCVDDLWVCTKPSGDASGMLSGSRDTSQDWIIDEIISNDDNMTVTFHRALNTGDSQDRSFHPGDEDTIIWAMGEVGNAIYYKHLPTTRGYLKVDFEKIYECNETLPVSDDFSFSSPEGDWTAVWEFSSNGKSVTFQVEAKTEGWAAIGFNNEGQMPGADVVLAYIGDDGEVHVYDGKATARSRPREDEENGGRNDLQSVIASKREEDGETYINFQFTRETNTGDSADVPLVAGTMQYLLYALGSVGSSGPLKHSNKGVAQMDFFAGGNLQVGTPPLQQAHGSLMMTGWIILLSSGAIVGHKYRPFTDKWFPTHVGLQVSGAILVLIAFVIIFVERGGFYSSPHAIIGVIVFTFMLSQIVLGIISNRVPSVRHTVHIIHRWLGRLTLILAFVNIMLGYFMVRGALPLYVICGLYFVVALVAFFWPLKSPQAQKDIDLDNQKGGEEKYLTLASKVLFLLTVAAFTILCITLIAYFVVTSGTSVRPTHVTYGMTNYGVPNQMTSYVCITIDFALTQPVDVEKISPVVDNAETLHHMILFGMDTLVEADSPVWDCAKMPNGQPIWVWAVGGGDFVLPENVGLRLGPGAYQYGVLQFHYDLSWSSDIANANQFDSSGVKLSFHSELQTHQMGVVRLGVPMSQISLPPNTANVTKTGTCSSEATQALGNQELTVFSTVLHMHQLGKTISLEQRRNGNFLAYFAETSQWDFNNQQFYKSNNVVKAGDALVTRCTWDTTGVATVTLGGEDSNKEMCFAFIYYYPLLSTSVQACGA